MNTLERMFGLDELKHLGPEYAAFLLCLPPILYFLGGLGGLLAGGKKLTGAWRVAGPLRVAGAWRVAGVASGSALLLAVGCCVDALWGGKAEIGSLGQVGECRLSFRLDTLESLMLLLVAFLGWVIVRYSRGYMAGDPREAVYIRCLMRTLAAVSLLVVTNSLLVFLVAWVLTGLSIHGLLTLYPNRQAAVIAAHKKFWASRLGDFTLLVAVFLLGSGTKSFEMDEVVRRVGEFHPVPLSIHLAVVLLAVSAMVKCAQLPLHGWLIQVMEAPTPVSALLHAGVVNLGGFMLIRLAGMMDSTPAAQGLLVVVGGLTAVISALVMTTRISIKVNLAWSTCAQMGFMLLECGLGLYQIAFLHLLAHSVYKAHAFLGSGGTVRQAELKSMMPVRPTPGWVTLVASGVCGVVLAAAGAAVWLPASGTNAAMVFCIPVVGLAVAGILGAIFARIGRFAPLLLLGAAFGVSALYFSYDALLERILPVGTDNLSHHLRMVVFSVGCFVVLYGIQMMVRVNPLGRVATWLYPWFYAGLYLDELFTRVTFWLWSAAPVGKKAPSRDVGQSFVGGGGR